MHGYLTGAHGKGHGLSAPVERIVHALAEHVVFLVSALLKGDLTVQMRSRYHRHGAVFFVHVIDS